MVPSPASKWLFPLVALGWVGAGCLPDMGNPTSNKSAGTPDATLASPDAGAPDTRPIVIPQVDAEAAAACTPSFSILSPRPVKVLLVLDRSISMSDSPPEHTESWWNLATGAVNSIVQDSEHVLDWGLMLFPKGTTSECCKMPTDDLSPIIEVPAGPGNASAIASAMANAQPTGEGTPTARALLQAANYLSALSTSAQKLIVLATDGDPTCANDSICMGNESKDYDRTKAAIAHVYNVKGIPVAVVGISYPDSSSSLKPNEKQLLLIELAKLGGLPNLTPAQPAYFLAANPEQLLSTFQALRDQTISCTFETGLSEPWPHAMKVTVGETDIKRDKTHTDGWDLQDGGESLTLFGSPCEALQEFPDRSTQLALGCPNAAFE